jgi:hypothetical protein
MNRLIFSELACLGGGMFGALHALLVVITLLVLVAIVAILLLVCRR